MFRIDGQQQDVVLFYAEQSLTEQITSFACKRRCLFVRSVSSCNPAVVNDALSNAGYSLIDATERPARAMDLLEYVLPRVGRERLAVYTERVYEGLEIFVRVRGVLLLLGPMTPTEWSGLFRPLRKAPFRLITSTAAGSPSERPKKVIPMSPLACRQGGRL